MTVDEKRVHFIGIGGIGMSGIAAVMLRKGIRVTGSDVQQSDVTHRLESLGAQVAVGNSAENVPRDAQLVVISAAVELDNPELVAAESLSIPVQKYAQVLGSLMSEFKGIAVSGTHGKTTTSAMIACILKEAGLDPNFVVGAMVDSLGGSSGVGSGEHFVVEACEYDRSFLNLHPMVALINNIEEDHLDYYRDLSEIVSAFGQFASQVHRDGLLVVNAADAAALGAAEHARCEVQTFGVDCEADWQARAIETTRGRFSFEALFRKESLGRFELGIPGVHNVSNALGALACVARIGVNMGAVRRVLSKFKGAERRFQIIGGVADVTVIDDYAHHPTEIRVTLDAARKQFGTSRIWAVFQPHQHSRTRFFMEEFAESFTHADVVIVPEIYFVRDSDSDRRAVTAEDLVRRMKTMHTDARHIREFDDIVGVLKDELRPGDVVITRGAGDVNQVGQKLVEALRAGYVPGRSTD